MLRNLMLDLLEDRRSLSDSTLDQCMLQFCSLCCLYNFSDLRDRERTTQPAENVMWANKMARASLSMQERERKSHLTTTLVWHCRENKNTGTRWAARSPALPLSVKTARSHSTQPLLHSKSLQYAEWHVCTFASGMKQIVRTRASSSHHTVTLLRESTGNKEHIKTQC